MKLGDELKRELGQPDAHFAAKVAETLDTLETEKPAVRPRRSLTVVLAVLLAALLGTAAAASLTMPGIRELLSLQSVPAAETMVQQVYQVWSTDYAVAEVRELIYDGQGVSMVMDVRPTGKDRVLLLPSMKQNYTSKQKAAALMVDGLVDDAESGETIAAYAERKGMKLVYFYCAVQNEDRSFVTYGQAKELYHNEDGSWTQVLRYPAAEKNSQLRVRLYTTVYDKPLTQTKLPLDDPNRSVSEVHSVWIPISQLTSLEDARTVQDAASIKASFISQEDTLVISKAQVIRTPIATYLDLTIDNPNGRAYSILNVYAVCRDSSVEMSDYVQFVSMQDYVKGYTSGVRYVAAFDQNELPDTTFDITIVAGPLMSEQGSGTATEVPLHTIGSAVISFEAE